MATAGGGELKSALRLVLGVAALYLLFKFARFGEVVATLATASAAGITLGLLLNLATRSAAAARTYTLSRVAGLPVTYTHTLQSLFVANFWGLALPGVSAGSVATVYRYRGHGAGIVQSVAVLFASRLIELAAFCALALLGLATAATGRDGSRPWAATLLLGIIAGIALLLLLLRYLPRLSAANADQASLSWLGRARVTVDEAIALVRGLPRRSLVQAAGWALLQGVLDALTVVVLAGALAVPIDLLQALWINALSYLAILLPVSAAGLGMREAAVLAALVPLGVSPADALSLALLMLTATLLNALIGAVLHFAVPTARAGLPER